MIINRTQGALQEAVKFAKSVGKLEDLIDKLKYLQTYACHENGITHTKCTLFKDFSPFSFEFIIEVKDEKGDYKQWFNGGLIFHGSIDGYGSGSAPTFAVTLDPTDGWAIHT